MDFWAVVALGLIGWAGVLCVVGFVSGWPNHTDPGHACDLPCVGDRGHYGPCCCGDAHCWTDRSHGMKRPTSRD